jgi:hypothetical protein
MSYKNTLLISEETLKNDSLISENMDVSMIVPTLIAVQDMYILPVLGSRLFDGLKFRIYEDTLTNDDRFILDNYIKGAIINGVLSEGAITFVYKYMNKTVAQNGGENQQPTSLKEIQYLKTFYADRMQMYLTRLSHFLCHNDQTYPEFSANDFPDVHPTKRAYSRGIYLGRKNTSKFKPNAEQRYIDNDNNGLSNLLDDII